MNRPQEIIVVGAGVVGCAVAFELARRGASVRIVDDRPPGMGATQASAGVLAPYLEVEDKTPEFLDLAVRSLALYDDFVATAVADSETPVLYHRDGTMEVATNAEQLSQLRNTLQRLEAWGVAASFLDARAVRLEEPELGEDVAGGLAIHCQGFVAAADLTRALALAAERRGARLVAGARAQRIAPGTGGGDGLVVEAGGTPLRGDAVVLAAGSWAGRIEVDGSSSRVPVRPVRGQLLHLKWSGPRLRRVTWGDRCYLVPWDDGTLLVGATVEEAGFDERATVAGVRDLLEAVAELLPRAWSATFLGARVGLRPGTPDKLPIIGPSSAMPNLMYATGHYRNGVLLAPLTARLVADAMLEGRIDPGLASVAPDRFGL